MARDGSVFTFLRRVWVLETAVLRGDAFCCKVRGIFLGKEWGDSTLGGGTVPRLQGCAQ